MRSDVIVRKVYFLQGKIMSYVNSKYSNCLQDGNSEIVEEGECSTIMVSEQEENNQSTSYSSSFISKSIASPLAALSVLEGAEGSQERSLEYYRCNISSSVCSFIASANISRGTIETAFNIAGNDLNGTASKFSTSGNLSLINTTIPLNVTDEASGNRNPNSSWQLDHLSGYLNDLQSALKLSEENSDFCGKNIPNLCNANHEVNFETSSRCCSDLRSYITDVKYADQVVHVGKDLIIFVVVLVAFLALAIAIFVFAGRRCHKSIKAESYNVGNVNRRLQSEVNEVNEDEVAEAEELV